MMCPAPVGWRRSRTWRAIDSSPASASCSNRMAPSRSVRIAPRGASFRGKANCATFARRPRCWTPRSRRRTDSLADLARPDRMLWPARSTDSRKRFARLTSNAADVQTEILKQTQQRERLTDEIALIRQEWEMLEEEIRRLEAFWRETRGKAEEAEQQAEELSVKWKRPTTRSAATSRSAPFGSRSRRRPASRLPRPCSDVNGLREAYQKLASRPGSAARARSRSE